MMGNMLFISYYIISYHLDLLLTINSSLLKTVARRLKEIQVNKKQIKGWNSWSEKKTRIRAVAGRTARCRYLYISIRIEFYNGIARFLCHHTAFLYSLTPALPPDRYSWIWWIENSREGRGRKKLRRKGEGKREKYREKERGGEVKE